MTTKTKIIIVVLLVAATIIAGVNIARHTSNKRNEHKKQSEISGITNVFNSTNNTVNNTVSNNTLEENTLSETNTISDNNVIGKEEQESKENSPKTDEKAIAIDLAQKEWGISIDSYNFEATSKGDGIYEVSVRTKTTRNEVTKYTVNTRLGTVVEAK